MSMKIDYSKLFVGEDWKVPTKYYPLLFVATLVALIQYPFIKLHEKRVSTFSRKL